MDLRLMMIEATLHSAFSTDDGGNVCAALRTLRSAEVWSTDRWERVNGILDPRIR